MPNTIGGEPALQIKELPIGRGRRVACCKSFGSESCRAGASPAIWNAKKLFLFFLLQTVTIHAFTQLEDLTWNEPQPKTLSRSGQEALQTHDVEWHHAESEHFIYHFTQRWMAERAAAEAETYYEQIKKDLKITEDSWEVKGHIFLFETEPSWKSFTAKAGVDQWSGGVCIGNEIFLLSPPKANPFTGTTLPHEMAHLAVNRFVRGKIPIWLNEGFAEQQSRKHFVAYTKPKGFHFLLQSNVVASENYIPLEELTAANDYPSEESKVGSFYTESLRLVQFLVEDHPKQNFLEFLQAMADGMRFDHALDRVYGNIYLNFEAFEIKFKEVAISKVKLVEDHKKGE